MVERELFPFTTAVYTRSVKVDFHCRVNFTCVIADCQENRAKFYQTVEIQFTFLWEKKTCC